MVKAWLCKISGRYRVTPSQEAEAVYHALLIVMAAMEGGTSLEVVRFQKRIFDHLCVRHRALCRGIL